MTQKSSNNQLSKVSIEGVQFKIDNGLALTAKEIAVKTGYCYHVVLSWKLPLLSGKITWEDFQTWKMRRIGLEASHTPVARKKSGAGRDG